MAEAHGEQGPGPRPDTMSDSLSRLRSIAENHLGEIEEEKLQEEAEEARGSQEVERYMKHRRRGKGSRSLLSSATATPTPKMKMRSAQDVLSRLQWDADHDMASYTIGYLERFAGIKEMPASSWIAESTEEEWIPQHRIKYFKRTLDNGDQEVVWGRDKRLDRIFGSGLGSTGGSGSDDRPEDGGVISS
ncbi:hypothetical protein A1O3_01141 [Capronia epimyces CBS 606.96]|uniref:MJ1316 RNA cyclic group end recognition domain-containing protein n=1 Tax=Capronia epimyces CBS 606.96 TaxID=1182542 RepID=W9ZDJ7_9EURO|nr:uncharacterized protein A1O3_01141 [Capronia epimyces CBS 606.96]EXJ92589.1 hypothetical protein A1O3_01141 [Capronia epimyces CBS 606.96]